MRRRFLSSLLVALPLAACGEDQNLEHDLDPILLARAPIVPGGTALGGLLAATQTAAGIEPLLVDTAFPLNSVATAGCPSSDPPGWTYTGTMAIYGVASGSTPLRASFTNVGLFDQCPGPTGDSATQPAGVLGGSLLANFSLGLSLPRDPQARASMTLWPVFPGTDDELAQNGQAALHFNLRGGVALASGTGESSLTLPSSRFALTACVAPKTFATTDPVEPCATGASATTATGANLMLAVGTGEGPLILSNSAWARVATAMGVAADSGTQGDLFTPFSTVATPARFVTVPRLALFQSTTDSNWIGPCAELARARRIEWVLANQASGACFQPCDASGGQAFTTYPYLELDGTIDVAVVDESSDILQSLNSDVPPNPQIDGVVGAGTLAGTRLWIDYQSSPNPRIITACEEGSTRTQCWSAPSCPSPSVQSQQRVCFGQLALGGAPMCQ